MAQKPAAKFGFAVEPPAPGKGQEVGIRRVAPVDARSGEDPLSEPTAVP